MLRPDLQEVKDLVIRGQWSVDQSKALLTTVH